MDAQLVFGRWIKQRRRALELTQKNVARSIGCSVTMIQKIESGARRPSLQIARRLATYLNLPFEDVAPGLPLLFDDPAGAPPVPPVPAVSSPCLSLRPPTALPHQPGQLFGREREAGEIGALLLGGKARLLNLTGPAGVGKTRLALEVARALARHYAEGIYVVELAPLRDAGQVLGAICQVVGVEERAQGALDGLVEALQGRQMLLLLDNVEHVVAAAPMLAKLLARCEGLTILATSRASLHVRWERRYPLALLATPEARTLPGLEAAAASPAVALFVERAQAITPQFTLTPATVGPVVEICRRLDGLPLAIELAAARLALFSVHELRDLLSDQLSLLAEGAWDRPEHHQTLRAALGWSYALLGETEQRQLVRLGVFVGCWSLEAALAIWQDGQDVLPRAEGQRILAALVDNSLVQRIELDGVSCFRLLETMRAFVLEQLGVRAREVRWRHARYYLALAEQAESELLEAKQRHWQARLERELDNIRAALAWTSSQGDAVFTMRLAAALRSFWAHGHSVEGQRWLQAALALSGHDRPVLLSRGGQSVRAKTLCCLGTLLLEQGQVASARAALEESLQIYQQLGHRAGCAMAQLHLCRVYSDEERFEEALGSVETSLALYRELGDPGRISYVLNVYGTTLMAIACKEPGSPLFFSSLARAEQLYGESLALCEAGGPRAAAIAKLVNLGATRQLLDDSAGAAHFFKRALRLSEELGHKRGLAIAHFELGLLAYHQHDDQRALTASAQALALFCELDHTLGSAAALVVVAALAARHGDQGRAALLCGWVDAQLGPQGRLMRSAELYEQLGALEPGAWGGSWQQGRLLALDEVLSVAAEIKFGFQIAQ